MISLTVRRGPKGLKTMVAVEWDGVVGGWTGLLVVREREQTCHIIDPLRVPAANHSSVVT